MIPTGGDGFFDFLPGLTIDAQNGRIFTTKEPFGELLFSKLFTGSAENYDDVTTYNEIKRNMYSPACIAAPQAGAYRTKKINFY
jgi:cell surface protein SprA